MLQHAEEDINVLNSLGLTILQAQVYLALSRLGKANVKTISANTSIDRAHVYRVVSSLQELGLVEKHLTKPTTYLPLSIDEGIQMLLENKTQEIAKIGLKAKDTIKRNRKSLDESNENDNYDFAIIPMNKTLIRKLTEIQNHCCTNYDFIFNAKLLLKQVESTTLLDEFRKVLDDLIDRGIKIRLIACLAQGENLYKEYSSLSGTNKLELRYSLESPPVTLTLADKKEALFNTVSLNPDAEPSLWTKNQLMVLIFQNYFDQRWRNAKKTNV